MDRQKSLSEINRLLGITYQKKHSDKQLHEMYKNYESLLDCLSGPALEALADLGSQLLRDDDLMQEINFDAWLATQPQNIQTNVKVLSQKFQDFENTDDGKALKNAGWIK